MPATLRFFESMTNIMMDPERGYDSISPAEFAEFEKVWIIYILQEKRYGQAFCEHFGLSNWTPLYFFTDEDVARRWIISNYIIKE